MNLTNKSSEFLFSMMETIINSSRSINHMFEQMMVIHNDEENKVKFSDFFIEDQKRLMETKIRFNNEAVEKIEKELSKRMKKIAPNICVFGDVDKLSKRINDEYEKGLKKDSKTFQKGLVNMKNIGKA